MTVTNPFFGILVHAPFVKTDKVSFYGTLRTGVVNRYFAVCVPGLETDLKLSNALSLGVGVSVRMTYPSASLKLNIRL